MRDLIDAGRLAARDMSRLARAALETCTPDDRLLDYVLHEYRPPADPVGKPRAVNLLFESFALAGVESEGLALVDKVRAGLGRDQTVFGIKERDGEVVGWELYFYDYQRANPNLSIARMRELLDGLVTVDAREPYALPWHMFSIEVSAEQLRARQSAPAHVYLDMRSYELRGDRLTFENIYTFHDPTSEIDDILHRLQSSVHFDARRLPVVRLMPPHLFRAHRICVANKRQADAIYFSRIGTPALETFLVERRWPEPLLRFVRNHAASLDHLLWDVGVDFDGSGGELNLLKSGLYGSF